MRIETVHSSFSSRLEPEKIAIGQIEKLKHKKIMIPRAKTIQESRTAEFVARAKTILKRHFSVKKIQILKLLLFSITSTAREKVR